MGPLTCPRLLTGLHLCRRQLFKVCLTPYHPLPRLNPGDYRVIWTLGKVGGKGRPQSIAESCCRFRPDQPNNRNVRHPLIRCHIR
jgi:hypothetical protein